LFHIRIKIKLVSKSEVRRCCVRYFIRGIGPTTADGHDKSRKVWGKQLNWPSVDYGSVSISSIRRYLMH